MQGNSEKDQSSVGADKKCKTIFLVMPDAFPMEIQPNTTHLVEYCSFIDFLVSYEDAKLLSKLVSNLHWMQFIQYKSEVFLVLSQLFLVPIFPNCLAEINKTVGDQRVAIS